MNSKLIVASSFVVAIAAVLGLVYGTYMVLGVVGVAAWFVLICIFLMLVILIQKPKGGGLSGAFGGSGGSAQTAFGSKTGDVLTGFTIACFVLFLGIAMGLTWGIHSSHSAALQPAPAPEENSLQRALEEVTDGVPGSAAEGTAGTGAPEAMDVPPVAEPAPVNDLPAVEGGEPAATAPAAPAGETAPAPEQASPSEPAAPAPAPTPAE